MTDLSSVRRAGLTHDLGRFWQLVQQPFLDAYRWPLLAWLTPSVAIRLRSADGKESIWHGDIELRPPKPQAGRKINGPVFHAVELPESLVLKSEVTVPVLAAPDIEEAIAMEARRMAPFASGDLLWGYRRIRQTGNAQSIVIAMASRKQVLNFLESQPQMAATIPPQSPSQPSHVSVPAIAPEIWVMQGTSQPILLPGFGETLRLRHLATRRRLGYVLLALAMALTLAIAVTPTVQLRERALAASDAFTQLTQRLAPALAKREAYLQGSNQLVALADLVDASIDPALVLAQVTQLLPDNTTLLSLQVQGAKEGHKVSISGQTDNTAELMQRLSATPSLTAVKAPVAATRPPGANKEVFVIEFILNTKASGKSPVTPSSVAKDASPGAPS